LSKEFKLLVLVVATMLLIGGSDIKNIYNDIKISVSDKDPVWGYSIEV
jgi:hypothetical protein